MMAVVAREKLAALPLPDLALRSQADRLAATLRSAIEAHTKVDHPIFGPTYADEVDGPGHHLLIDNANLPTLLAMPYLGYCHADDPLYQATRAFKLSAENPFYFKGKAASGIGSPPTPDQYVWPIALYMQGLTSTLRSEQLALWATLMAVDDAMGLMHEGFHKDDPTRYTRPWFSWTNALFAEFVLELCQE